MDKLVNHGHVLSGVSRFVALPLFLLLDFYRDRNNLPNYRFP